MSLQEYLLAELVRNASLRSPADLVNDVTERIRAEGADGFARVSSASFIRDDRGSH